MARLPVEKHHTSYKFCDTTVEVARRLADHYGVSLLALIEWIIREDTPILLRAPLGVPLPAPDAVSTTVLETFPELAYPQDINRGKREKFSVNISLPSYNLLQRTHQRYGLFAGQMLEWLIFYHAAQTGLLDTGSSAIWQTAGSTIGRTG